MKKFKFSLQTVHNLRESARDKEEQELVSLRKSVEEAATHVERIENERTRVADNYSSKLSGGTIDPIEAALTSNYMAVLVHRERSARTNLKQTEHAVDMQRAKLTEATRNVEATSRLRERQRERHENEALRKEQNLLDELATAATARRMVHGK
jgi:flagellar export protein FliJ